MSNLNHSFWNDYFRTYDVLNRVYPYRELLSSVMNEMDLSSKKLVLDAGAGTGNLAVLIAAAGSEVVGLDSSSIGLGIFKEKLPAGEVILHDLKNSIPMEDNKFDYVCCINTIFAMDHDHRENVCKEFFRLLKPGGKIIMTNLVDGYRPIRIYSEHLSEEVKNSGWIYTIVNLFRLIVPAVKMFNFNRRIKSELMNSKRSYLLIAEEQTSLLERSGFQNISPEKKLFAKQAILSTGFKV